MRVSVALNTLQINGETVIDHIHHPGGGGIPYERGGNARRLA